MQPTQNRAMIGNSALEERDARYTYNKHGPLARTELGQQQVQGVDYAYTLQGWLKGVNGIQLDTARDIGNDGSRTLAARDAYAFQLNYYAGDYRPIQGRAAAQSFPVMSTSTANGPNYLYNGNISSMAVNIGVLGQGQLSTYGYDQLNRLVSVDVQRAAANWSS